MPNHLCVACGTQHEDTPEPPDHCAICSDDRQYIHPDGQRWTTMDDLASLHRVRIAPDGDLLGVGIDGRFAIPQRALLVPSDAGNIFWDCVSLVTPEAVTSLEASGGVDLIAISHPHFYSSMVAWSDALGRVPILLHEADRRWIARPSQAIETWSGDRLTLSATTSLLHLPGHFPGSAALHWTEAPAGRSALLTGDSLHVAADRRHVSVMHSVPNHLPVGPGIIEDLLGRLQDLRFDDVYGFTWGLNIIGGADRAVEESLRRYLRAITDPSPTTSGRR